ncbi:hypothetical protein TNCT_578611 [Trichonephila clavata]|uniref:Uncharacterized protein n=1 Tax=Trichonephila clavata TaxID=2740835 RepID=A0A8X6LPP8_TRICU|nr:hypothetical protein TNCT_578611 [Trichonephila clavata]
MAMCKKGRSLNPAELETVINEICADDVSDNDIMITELDKLEENVVNTENSNSDTEEILRVQSTSTSHTISEE